MALWVVISGLGFRLLGFPMIPMLSVFLWWRNCWRRAEQNRTELCEGDARLLEERLEL